MGWVIVAHLGTGDEQIVDLERTVLDLFFSFFSFAKDGAGLRAVIAADSV
jgi:hypothetical protein